MNKSKSLFVKFCAFSVVLGSLLFSSCVIPTEDQKIEEENARETTLQPDSWFSGRFSKDGQVKKFSFFVTAGNRYFIYLNDSGDGDKTKTADVGMEVSHTDGTAISVSYSSASDCYTKPLTFLASSSGKISITVASYLSYNGWEKGTGTYAIKYTSRPEYDLLIEKEWTDDLIIAEGQTNKYAIPGKENTRYFIYINDTDAGSAMSTKTANIGLRIFINNETIICDKYDYASNCYTYPYTFVTTSNDTIRIIAASYRDYYGWEQGTGTYALRYTTRPEYDELPVGEWVDDTIVTDGQINKYTIDVIKGNTYKIYLNDIDAGSGVTKKTANVGLKIYYDPDSDVDFFTICDDYGKASNCFSPPYSFEAEYDATVIISAASYRDYYGWELGTGSYAIKYTVAE